MRSAALQDRPGAATRSDPAYLEVRSVAKWFRSVNVIDHLDLAIRRGELISLLGPSGCGKTTLLRLIAGLLPLDTGQIVLDGRDLTRVPAHRRNVGVVFQNYALFPHLNVAENVAFGLKAKRLPREEIRRAVTEALATVRLGDFADRPITGLSGGQQQRVAVARAIVVKPALLLLDEPFGALDRKLRETMQIELRSLLRRLDITSIFVTHDQDEALTLSDQIAVMQHGRIEQLADPDTIYNRPATPYVLDFVGASTRFLGRVVAQEGPTLRIKTRSGVVQAKADIPPGAEVLVAVRPERVQIGTSKTPDRNAVSLPVRELVFLGSRTIIHFDAAEDDRAVAEATSLSNVSPGMVLDFHWPIDETVIYRIS